MSTKRITITITEESASALERMAEEEGISVAEASRRALSLFQFIMREAREGSQLYIKSPGEEMTQMKFLFS